MGLAQTDGLDVNIPSFEMRTFGASPHGNPHIKSIRISCLVLEPPEKIVSMGWLFPCKHQTSEKNVPKHKAKDIIDPDKFKEFTDEVMFVLLITSMHYILMTSLMWIDWIARVKLKQHKSHNIGWCPHMVTTMMYLMFEFTDGAMFVGLSPPLTSTNYISGSVRQKKR